MVIPAHFFRSQSSPAYEKHITPITDVAAGRPFRDATGEYLIPSMDVQAGDQVACQDRGLFKCRKADPTLLMAPGQTLAFTGAAFGFGADPLVVHELSPSGQAWALAELNPRDGATGVAAPTARTMLIDRNNATLSQPPTAVEFPSPLANSQALVLLNDQSKETWSYDGVTWTRTGYYPSTAGTTEKRPFSQLNHGLVVGDRVYVDAGGQFKKGDATEGQKIPRLLVATVVNVNAIELVPIGGAYIDDAATTWDVTAGGTITNSRYAKTADDGSLAHTPGSLDNVERYYIGGSTWILLGGRPVATVATPSGQQTFPANGTAYLQMINDTNLWMVDPIHMTPPDAVSPAAPTTLMLQLAANFNLDPSDATTIKNASSQIMTLVPATGQFIDGLTNVQLSPGQSVNLVRSALANQISAV